MTTNNSNNSNQEIAQLRAELAKKNRQKAALKAKVVVINLLLLTTNFFGILTVGSVFFMQRIVAPQVQSK